MVLARRVDKFFGLKSLILIDIDGVGWKFEREKVYDVSETLLKRHIGTIRSLKLIAKMEGKEVEKEKKEIKKESKEKEHIIVGTIKEKEEKELNLSELKKIKGIGKKTLKDIKRIYENLGKDKFLKKVEKEDLSLKDNICKLLFEYFRKEEF